MPISALCCLHTKSPMGLEEHRVAMGMFHSRTCRLCGPFVIRTNSYSNIFRTNLRCSLFFVCLLLLQGLNPNVNSLFSLFHSISYYLSEISNLILVHTNYHSQFRKTIILIDVFRCVILISEASEINRSSLKPL